MFVRPPSNPVVELIRKTRLVAILRLDDLTHAVPLVEALLRGGVRAIEFTLTNPEAPAMVTKLRKLIPAFDAGEAVIGIGSVRSGDEATTAIDAGAQFLVSPITLAAIAEAARKHQTTFCMGAMTPTEMSLAWELGADVVKVFPARSLGPDYIRDVLAPMPYLPLMPTGAIDTNNARAYLQAGAVAVGVGGKFMDRTLIAEQRWDEIESVASEYCKTVARSASHE